MDVKQIHLYNIDDVLKPQGSLRNESLSLAIIEKMKDAFESWTDPKYDDSVDKQTAIDMLMHNLEKEVIIATVKFLEFTNKQ